MGGKTIWISKRTDYATRAVLALALAGEERAVKLDELAERTAVPPSVLEQVMPALRTAGIVRSERGSHGGYRLNRQVMPFMFGLILGEYCIGAFWSAMSVVTGIRTYDFAPG